MSSISGGINFQGMSGTDFSAVIDQMKTVEELPRKQMESWHDDWQRRYDAFDELLVGIKDLETALKELNTVGKIIQKEANTSEDGVATATASAEAENGTTSINVEQLATNAVISFEQKFYKNSVITKDESPAVLENFTYKYKGETHTVQVPTGTTAEGLTKLINEDVNNPGVSAALLKSGDQYVFQLQGEDTGADSNLEFPSPTDTPPLNTGFPGLNGATAIKRDAVDAIFTINGFDDVKLTSSTNTIEDVVKGLKINIIDTGKAEITVTQSSEGIKEKVTEFMDATNALLDIFDELTAIEEKITGTDTDSGSDDGVDNDTDTGIDGSLYGQQGGLLTGNYGTQMLMSNFKSMLTDGFVGSSFYSSETGQGDEFRTLAAIGIITDTDEGSDTYGRLILYEDLAADEDGVSPPITKEKPAEIVFDSVFSASDPVIAGDPATDPNVPFEFNYGGDQHIISVKAGSTASELAEQINAASREQSIGVNASAQESPAGSGNFKFAMKGAEGGKKHDLLFEAGQTGVNLSGYSKTAPKDAVYSPFRTLDSILETDPLAVANLLAGNSITSTSSEVTYNSHLDKITEVGSHEVTYDRDSEGFVIPDTVMIGGLLASPAGDGNYTAQAGYPSAGISINIAAKAKAGSHTSSINLQQGKTQEMLGFLGKQTQDNNTDNISGTDGGEEYEKGALIILKDSYETIMDNIQKKIDREIDRVARWEVQQREHYARLDALLVDYQGKAQSITTALGTMPPIV